MSESGGGLGVDDPPRVPDVRPAGRRRPRWWQEVLFIGVCYALYTLTRNALPSHVGAAMSRAREILSVERRLHLDPELAINHFVDHVHWLAFAANYWYATTHFVVTIGALVWVYAKRPLAFRAARTVLFVTTGLGLLGFYLYALAPPRMLANAGFVDTVLKFHTWGSWGSGAVAKASNQYAAMPSLHLAWAVWCGVTIATLSRRRWVKALAVAYPLITFFVIIGTANHFLADAAGGVLAIGLGYGAESLLARRPFSALLGWRRKSAIVASTVSGASSTGK